MPNRCTFPIPGHVAHGVYRQNLTPERGIDQSLTKNSNQLGYMSGNSAEARWEWVELGKSTKRGVWRHRQPAVV